MKLQNSGTFFKVQTHGILKGSEEAWEPRITITVSTTMNHTLAYVYPGGSKGRPHAPLLLTANISDVAPVRGSWQVRISRRQPHLPCKL